MTTTGLEILLLNAVRSISPTLKSPVISTKSTVTIVRRMGNLSEVQLIFIPHWSRQDSLRKKRRPQD